MEDLEKIFKENPYAASDPEEMERLLMKNTRKGKRSPPPFSRLMLPVKMLTNVEQIDGLRFDVNLGLTQKFQLGASWNFSNRQPSNFSLMTMFSPNMSPQNMNRMNFINAKKDVTGKLEFNGNYFLTDTISLKAEGYMPNENVEASHVSLEVLKEFRDCHLSYKIGGGSHSFSMMQGVTDNLSAGFEAMWHPQEKRFIYNYGAKFVKDHHTIIAHYIPIAKKDMFTIGYVTKPSRAVQLFGELKIGEVSSETTIGFKMAFNSGLITGTMSNNFKASSGLTVMMD